MALRIHLSTLVLAVAAIAGCTSDVVSSSHATRSDAADIVERGWIPAVLPESAKQIRETHDVDTNTGHGTFVFGPADAESFRTALRPIPAEHAVRASSRSALERSGYTLYAHGEFEIAVNWTDRRGEFWLGPSP